jgi:hypothetical protein
VALYSDVILSSPVVGTPFTDYISSGTVNKILDKDNNIALGTDAGKSLIDGEKNFLLGYSVAKNLTTGTGNILIGHEVADNLVRGSYNISIGGDNLVEGKNDQVNIGSIFYYDGEGTLQLNSDTEVGVGTTATINTVGYFNTTTVIDSALTVIGGAGIYNNLIVGDRVDIYSTEDVTTSTYGALHVYGGATIDKNLKVNGSLTAGTSTFNTVQITSTLASTSTTTGALTVAGGVGVQGSIYSIDGIPDENYLIRIPRLTLGTTQPVDPKVGDIWIDTSLPAYLLWVRDGTDTCWVQLLTV